MLLMPPILRRCPLRFPHDAAADALLRTSVTARCAAPSARRLTSASSAVMQSMEELIDHAAAGKRHEQDATSADRHLFASPFLHTSLDETAMVHPTAVVDARASLGRNVRVGPYSIVGPDVVLEDGVVLQSHVVIEGKTRIGSGTFIHPFACLGGEPQDKKHNPQSVPHTDTALFQLEVGRKCVIREHVTIHGSTSYSAATPTSLGDNCWILCGAHVGHDVQIGSHVVLSNNVCVAGHVEIGSFAIIGGQVGLKQYIKIGSLAMIGGGSAVDGDVLPYGLASGNRAKLLGLNLIGLRRAKISRHQIKLMLRVVRYLFGSSLTNIAAVCPKTGFAPALDLPHHDSVFVRAFEAKRYLADIEVTLKSNPFVHEIMMTIRSKEVKERSTREDNDATALPEAEALLSSQKQTPSDGVANAEDATLLSSPFLVRPLDKVDEPNTNGEKPKRKKQKKPRKASDIDGLRAPRSKSKNRDSNNPLTNRSSRQKGSSDNENHLPVNNQDQVKAVRQPSTTCSMWSLLSRCICFRASLRSPVSTTGRLAFSPEEQIKLKALDKTTRKSHVEVYVRHTDNMPFSSSSLTSYGHPIVVIHVVDACTGFPLAAQQHTRPATFSANMLNSFEWNSSHVWQNLTLTDFLSPQVVVLIEIVEPRKRRMHRRLSMQLPTRQEIKRTRNPAANSKDPDYDLRSEVFFRRIAWAFFRPISDHGSIRLPLLSMPDDVTAHDGILRLQLYTWSPLSWLAAQQARSQFHWNPDSGDGVPTVFLQYQRRTRRRLPCTIHVEIRPVAALVKCPTRLDGVLESVSKTPTKEDNVATESNQVATINATNSQPTVEQVAISNSIPDLLLRCNRRMGEPCVIPQRVLHRIPTGRHGCSSLAFSPDGLFLAAAVHHATSTADEWLIQVYETNSGVLWQSCRGHQSMVYAVEWARLQELLVDKSTKALVSASSDGTAIRWELRDASHALDRSRAPVIVLPSRVFQHVPAPVFVYCAIFHTAQPHLIVTGSSDGTVRLWDTHPSLNEASSTSATRRAYVSTPAHEWNVGCHGHSVAIHSIRMETKQPGRLFCGDSSGTITVWTPATFAAGKFSYELSKTVRTGQRSIASLALHPRKQHLIVLTHPHALFQYETRSFLLLHKNYAGIECDQLLAKASFSPDGQYVVSGSEDGVPHLFAAVEGVRLNGSSSGLWGHRFFHGFPLMEIAWSATAHVVAMGAYGEAHPIVVLSANREDRIAHAIESKPSVQTQLLDSPHSGSATINRHLQAERFSYLRNLAVQVEDPAAKDRITERAFQRRQQRLQAKLARELDAAPSLPSSQVS